MIFNSLEYAAFLPLVFVLYWRMGPRPQLWLLLVASYVFYGWWDPRFLLLIAASTLADFWIAGRIDATTAERRRLQLLWTSIGFNLGVLAVFKYYGFFVDSAQSFLTRIGLDATAPTLRILLPVGISFYTFQTISYSFDVYRRRIPATRDPLTFAVYVAFFPQLVAGPIERAQHLLPQIQQPRIRPTGDALVGALFLIGQGLVKKVVIADGLAPYVNETFDQAGTAGAAMLLVSVVSFAFQIYGDFSGYTDVARGSSRLLGVDLMENFRQPYLSRSITEFWRHWHISLSTWLRDYLYVPLGGNRAGRYATYRNLIITMVLGGLWHGAAWTFVAWGAWHGVLLAGHRLLGREREQSGANPTLRELPFVLGTFALVCIGWVLFRARSLDQAVDVLTGIATLRAGAIDADAVASLVLLGGAAVLLDVMQRRTMSEVPVLTARPVAIGATAGLALSALVVFSGGTPVPFIYFQF